MGNRRGQTNTRTPVENLRPDHLAGGDEGVSEGSGAEVTIQADPWNIPERHGEHHITVVGDPIAWRAFCAEQFVKPLYIELSDMRIQLMCAALDPFDAGTFIATANAAGFKVIRHKHEVSAVREDEHVVYWECHVKIDGPFQPELGLPNTSRDLYRQGRWYVTHRSLTPFDAEAFADRIVARLKNYRSVNVDAFEYEACIMDTNPSVDRGWLR